MTLLLDPNVWIADTGATVHATPNSSVMIKKSERNENDSVTMGNGKSEATECYGDLPVTLCDMEGNTCHSVAIKIRTIHLIEVVISITTIITYLHNYI
jgi:hypothetical protein